MSTRLDSPSPPFADLAATAPDASWMSTLARRPLRRLVQRLLDGITRGSVSVQLPDGQWLQATAAAPGAQATVVLHRWRALGRLLSGGDLGLAESYRDGDWSTPDLLGVMEFGLQNESGWGTALQGGRLARWLARLAHLRRANTRSGSRDNISFHYDMGNAFYAQWLDPSMLYSSAIYAHGEATLEQAQQARLGRIAELLQVPDGGSVLEIGCGWGALAADLARRHGAQVTGLTLSTEQLAHARERAAAQGLADRVDLRLQDYRDVQGRYDRIVSIEMIEAVGEAWWPTYFDTLRQRLADGGRAVLQVITIDEAHFDSYRRGADFIQRHIFPGGMLPTVTAMREHASAAGLTLRRDEAFGQGYALTLAEWRRRFLRAWPTIAAQGFDEPFRRLWEYYLCYCEAGFRSGRIDVGLYTLEPAGATGG
ncbi:MAG: class I SAM-dependent methyltransferase [Burkholderiaceae bacterium]|nr:class I SAM-dependent methyltransferase [Burkholderiaceae bacterium]